MRLCIVAAMSENRVIGRDGTIPWKLRDEQQALKRLTTGHCLIMGRKTWESIGRPLPGRTSIVVTRQREYSVPESVRVVADFDAALDAAKEVGCEQLFVFGGAALYELALPRADSLHLTVVHAEIEGDARFPEFDESVWRLVDESRHEADSRNEYAFTIRHYVRA